MSQVAKIHFSAPILLASAVVLSLTEAAPVAPAFFVWLAFIQILNVLAPRLPCPKLIHWTYAMTYEGLALAGIALLRLIPMSKKTCGNGRPILLIHGYINHGRVWRMQKKRLEAKGFGPIYFINLGHPFKSISDYAEKVKGKVEEIAKETNRKDLILIGHSMGGLVSCFYGTKLAAPGTVTDIITIGSPFIGTPMARIGLGRNAREMEPKSSFLKELVEAVNQTAHINFHHIASKTDQLVIPGGSAIIPHHKHFIYEDIGHTGLLYSYRVTEKITEWLSASNASTK